MLLDAVATHTLAGSTPESEFAWRHAAASTPVDPTTAQLERLAGLHGSGVLSDEEFAAAKARLLGL